MVGVAQSSADCEFMGTLSTATSSGRMKADSTYYGFTCLRASYSCFERPWRRAEPNHPPPSKTVSLTAAAFLITLTSYNLYMNAPHWGNMLDHLDIKNVVILKSRFSPILSRLLYPKGELKA